MAPARAFTRAPAEPADGTAAPAGGAAQPAGGATASAPDWHRAYGPGHGFTWRPEAFGGILYHYEGVHPDPRVTFVDNRFLIDLLDALQANPGVPLGDLLDGVQARFGLDATARGRMESFFVTLIQRGALVPH